MPELRSNKVRARGNIRARVEGLRSQLRNHLEQVAREREYHQRAVGDEMRAADLDSEQQQQERAEDGQRRRQIRAQRPSARVETRTTEAGL